MFRNHLLMAFRILRKQRLSSGITMAGLGIGLAFFALLAVFVRDELSFDRFHAKADRIYILTTEFRDQFMGVAHHFIAGILEMNYPEVKSGSSVRVALNRQTIRRGDRLISKDFAFVDPGFFSLFSFDLIAGDPDRALADPRGIVLSAATAEALALGPNPLGQILTVRIGEKDEDFAVSGIIRKLPGNSSLQFDGLLPFSRVFQALHINPDNSDYVTLPMFATTFLEISDAQKAASLQAEFPALNDRLYGEMWKRVKMDPPKQGFGLLRLTGYHLGPSRVNTLGPRSRPAFSWILSGIALLILILAGFNSVNLSLARNAARMKEIGVRKVIGARKSHLLGQLLTESLVAGAGALALGLIIAALLISSFNSLTGKSLDIKGLFQPSILAAMIAAVLIVCFFTGFIPSRTFFRHSPASLFCGRLPATGMGNLSRIFIVIQFTVSMVLLTGMLVMTRQLRYTAETDLGYDPTNIILVDTQLPDETAAQGEKILEAFRNALRPDPRVLAVTADSGIFPNGDGGITRRYDKDGVEHVFEAFQVDWDYLRAIDIRLVSGRGFSPGGTAEAREGILVNEALVKDFGLQDPLGKRFSEFGRDKLPAEYSFDPVIIGVVRDFHVLSLHEPIGPMAFGPKTFLPSVQGFRRLLIKIRPGETKAMAGVLEKIWAGLRPDIPFHSEFLEDTLAREYRRERNWSRIVGWAGAFALFISSLGLFGLTAVSVARRVKEIGIREVMGAGEADILILFLKEFLKGVAVAVVLSWPIAYLATQKWLELFAYRISPGFRTFAGAALMAFLIAGLTVSGQVLRAARANPARNLRYE